MSASSPRIPLLKKTYRQLLGRVDEVAIPTLCYWMEKSQYPKGESLTEAAIAFTAFPVSKWHA
ncbi:MAG: hypothetical protein LDL41_10400 [Coleofasciculus sp. S288]|nr:hypothetical protein [Coleofasciculus sp. S288]